VIEPETVIEPEAVPPARPARRRRQALVAGVSVLALVAGGVAVAAGGGRSEPKLALMAGNGAGGSGETNAGRSAAPTAALPAIGAADGQALSPYGGWGLKFEVGATLPDLPDRAAAWKVNGPALDRTAVARIAGALGLTGDPVQRDGGWFVDGGDWSLNAFDNGGTWSVNFYRGASGGRIADAGAADAPSAPAISRPEAEGRVRDLLDRMGAPAAEWQFETTETEVGVGWACAAPAPALSPEELKKLEADKLRQVQPDSPVNEVAPAPAMPAGKPAPDGPVASCPPPPPPVKGFAVALSPVLDGQRADWPVWNVTLRSDGRVENVYGSWVNFERGADYKLRTVAAALEALQTPPEVRPLAADTPAVATDMPAVAPDSAVSSSGVSGSGVSSSGAAVSGSGSAPTRLPADGGTATTPAIEPYPMPTVPPAPPVVTITGVEAALISASVFEDGKVRMALVPAYRFSGHFDGGSPWQASVIALHPDAIAAPPDVPVPAGSGSGAGGGVTGVGKAVPPTPAPEPAVLRD